MTDSDRLQHIEEKVDCLDRKLTELRVVVEHRLTRVEGRASFIGVLGVATAALVAWLIK